LYLDLKNKIKGPVYSVVTPFNKDQSIDFISLEKYIKRIYSSGGRIFYVMAYNSRFSELSFSEIKDLNQFVVNKVKTIDKSNIVIVADPLHCSTEVSIDFCNHASQIGADVISLIFREKFYSEKQVYTHYSMCSSATEIGLLIHEMPFISGLGGHTVNWPVRLLDKLADIENIVAIKEDAKEDSYSDQVIKCIKDRLSIIISGGGKRQWLRFSEKGCQAWLNGIGVFEPKLPIIFYNAYLKSDQKIIDFILTKIEDPFFNNICSKYGWHLSIKAALEFRGIFSRFERMPMMPIDQTEMKYVINEMKEIEKSINDLFKMMPKN
tara:strand:- start:14770 stop:15735 length:966 start_codon:yes stop_codon:yes gene_type:complete